MDICEIGTVADYVARQNERWIAHCVRMNNQMLQKRLLFNSHKTTKGGNRPKTVYEAVVQRRSEEEGETADQFHKNCRNRKL